MLQPKGKILHPLVVLIRIGCLELQHITLSALKRNAQAKILQTFVFFSGSSNRGLVLCANLFNGQAVGRQPAQSGVDAVLLLRGAKFFQVRR